MIGLLDSWRRGVGNLGIVLVVVLAGCVGATPTQPAESPTASPAIDTPVETPSPGTPSPSNPRTGGDGETTSTETPPRAGTPGFPAWDPPEEPFERITIGSAEATDAGSHTYTIWNHDDEARTIHVRIVQNGTTIHDQRHEFPALGAFEIALHTPATYRITVGVVGTDRSRTFTDPVASFDCNTKGVNVVAREDGIILARAYSTMMACQTPTTTPSPARTPTPTSTNASG